ncbi:MAG: thymidine phosphorylase [Candidatus Pacearchaeota archaeon]
MQLKIKIMKWSAGLPVAMLNSKIARKLGVHPPERISIKTISKNPKEITTILDIVDGFIKENEIAVSSELRNYLDFKNGQKVEINLAEYPKSISIIKKKLNNYSLSQKEMDMIVRDIVNNSLSDAEIALFISATYQRGMSMKEIIYLIKALQKTGFQLKFKKKIIADKHSIGGIPGNRTTPIVVSICAAAGLTMPKNSSRAITSAAGTADVIETIANVEFNLNELKNIIKKTNACMIWSGTLGLVPADYKIIKIEKSLKIDPEPQLIASIMSKKLAAGSTHIIIDIPYGKGAKTNKKQALALKKKFEYLGKYFGKNLKCVLTKGNQPIGNGIGPVLELKDVIKILDPNEKDENRPLDLKEKAIFLAGEIFELTGKAKKGEGKKLAKEILDSGKAFKKFKEIIKAQRGSLSRIKDAKFSYDIHAKKSGRILEINNERINSLARVAGCPIDKSAGVYLYRHLNQRVKKNERILTIYTESKLRLNEAIKYYKKFPSIIIK